MIAVLAFAMLPVAGSLAGAVVAELAPTSERWRNVALHAAAGVVVAIISVERRRTRRQR